MDAFTPETFEQNLLPEFPNYHISKDGKVFSRKIKNHFGEWREFAPTKTKYGLVIDIRNIEKIQKNLFVSNLVAEIFIGKRPLNHNLIHKDGNVLNSNASNLEYIPVPFPLESLEETLPDRFKGIHITKDGRIFSKNFFPKCGNPIQWLEIFPCLNSAGYKRICLSMRGKGRIAITVHKLVALAYLGEPPNKLCVCHNDGDKLNNNLSNLRYDTFKSNSEDMVRHGKSRKGELAHANKLSTSDVKKIILKTIVLNEALCDVAKEFNVSTHAISSICHNKTWKHIPRPIPEEDLKTRNKQRCRKFKKEDIILVFKLKKEKCTYQFISNITGISKANIWRILTRKFWGWVDIPEEYL